MISGVFYDIVHIMSSWNSLLMRRFIAWINEIQRSSQKFMPVRVSASSPFSSDGFKSLLHIIDSLLPVVKEDPPLQKMPPVCVWRNRKSGNGT